MEILDFFNFVPFFWLVCIANSSWPIFDIKFLLGYIDNLLLIKL